MRGIRVFIWLAAAGWPLAAASDDEPEAPDVDLELLEYLGSWQDEDEEWWLPAELAGASGRAETAREPDTEADPEPDAAPDADASGPPGEADARRTNR